MTKNKEWSLKGKEYWLTDKVNYVPDCDHQICNQKQINKFKRQKEEEEGTYYIKEDINTLREKLIEDIVEEFYGHYPWDDDTKEPIREEVTKIINKRFGVED